MTEALKEQDFTAYIDLVSHLRSLSILAFDKKDLEHLEKIDILILKIKKHAEKALKTDLQNSIIYNIETANYTYFKIGELKTFIEYRFSGVIERVCISALRKTIFREQVPEAQNTIFYNPSRDIELSINLINGVFEEQDISPYEV
jgi:hypothetical protein